jgi:hypothetical protein
LGRRVALKALPSAEAFRHLTEALGVVDVRESTDSGAIFVFMALDAHDEELDGVRVLARREWPDRSVVIARRPNVRQTGAHIHRFSSVVLPEPKREAEAPPSGDERTVN